MYKILTIVLIGGGCLVSIQSFAGDNVQDIFKTVTKNIPQVEQICTTNQVPIYGNSQPADSGNSLLGTIIGGVAGGLLGSTIGKGTGKTVATAGGAVAGAVAGNTLTSPNSSNSNQIVGYRNVTSCEDKTTYTKVTEKVYSHSEITFYHNGKERTLTFQR